MNDLNFYPMKKFYDYYLKTKNTLPKKKIKLLYIFCSKNIQLTKNDLLSSIWGVSESVNTHTLETHIFID